MISACAEFVDINQKCSDMIAQVLVHCKSVEQLVAMRAYVNQCDTVLDAIRDRIVSSHV